MIMLRTVLPVILWYTIIVSSCISGVHAAEEEEEVLCTHGKLFVSDTATSQIHVINLNLIEPVGSLVVETSVTVEGGPGAMDVYTTANGKVVATLYGGTAAANYTDGVINWIHTGIELVNHGDHSDVSFDPPTVLPNGAFRCANAVHFERNGGQIGIFCDGSFSGFINSTIWVIDESILEAGEESPIVYNATLLSSHHGVAVPVADDHVLYSVASPERINRGANASDYSLPSFFDVLDISNGTVIHQVDDSSSIHTHCSGYHGAAYFENTVILACDEIHGGVLIVELNETSDAAYSSRALSYPSDSTYDGYRAAHFEQHTKSDYIVSDFNNGEDMFNLMAFQPSDTVLTEKNLLPLSTLQCGFALEKSAGEVVVLLMPDGMVSAYEFDSATGWMKIAELLVYEEMSACNEVIFVVGYVQAFVITVNDDPTIYAVDLHHVHEGEMSYTTSSLDFVPYSAVVGGVPPLVACSFDGAEHDHDHESENDGSNSENKTTNNNTTNLASTSHAVTVTTSMSAAIPFFASMLFYVASF